MHTPWSPRDPSRLDDRLTFRAVASEWRLAVPFIAVIVIFVVAVWLAPGVMM